MGKNRHYEFVSKEECKDYLQRTEVLIDALVKRLKLQGIKVKSYFIGSMGKRNLVTRLVVNGKKLPIDADINLEINLSTVPLKYKKLGSLKEYIRSELNVIIKAKKEKFSDGSNSSSVLTYSLYTSKHILEFSFDVGIVSRNRDGDLQRLVLNKKTYPNLYTWNIIFEHSDIDDKVVDIKSDEAWNKLRSCYLKLKNQFIGDDNHPSFICYKMAVEEIYSQIKEQQNNCEIDFDAIAECIGEISLEDSLSQLNTLYQKGLISKPKFEFPKVDDDSAFSFRCDCYINSIEKLDGYYDRGIGEGNNKSIAKINAAYDILQFILYDDNDDEEDETWICPICGATNSSEDDICQTCFDDDD